MNEINRYKLNLYNLLYQYPPCEYRTFGTDSDEMRVLFIGKRDKAIETYKILFWASQYPDSKLKMTYGGCKEDLEYVKEHFNDKNTYPALHEYLKKDYANKIELRELVSCEQIELSMKENLYKYIIISTDDAENDWNIIERLEAICDKNQKKMGDVFIALYNDSMSNKVANINWSKVAKNVSIKQFELTEEEREKSDLCRMASNINLAYNMKYNQRLNISDTNSCFEEKFRKEFEMNDSREYDADSSYASAVHISSKLAFCLDYYQVELRDFEERTEKAIELLAESIEKKNELYDKLIVLEHRRWNAYMVMRGYRYPRNDEWKFVYDGHHKNVDREKKLHVCLCESGSKLNPKMKQRTFWENKSIEELAPLDYVSYKCNMIAGQKAKELQKRIYQKNTFLSSILFKDLHGAIEMLFNEEDNSIANYRKVYKEIHERSEVRFNSELLKQLEVLNQELQIVIIHNQRINFFEYDAQLVEMIPFCVWYGKKYQRVIVFSEGVPTKDVILPTLLYAKEAIFVSENPFADNYSRVVEEYFASRGSNTASQFVVYHQHKNKKPEYDADRERDIVTGGGFLKEQFLRVHNELLNLRYDAKAQLIKGDTNLFVGMEKQSFSVDEFIHLLGGDIIESAHDTLDMETFNYLERMFWEKYSNLADNGKTGKEKRTWIPWNECALVFQNGRMSKEDKEITIDSVAKDIIYVFDESMSEKIYRENSIDIFLTQLYDFHLIERLQCRIRKRKVVIQFITYHKEIINLLATFCGDTITTCDYQVVFGDLTKVIISANELLNCRSKKYRIDYDDRRFSRVDASFFQTLQEAGYCSDVQSEEGEFLSLTAKDDKVRKFIQFAGDILEKSVYHKMRKSGVFDDVSTGVQFIWNKSYVEKGINKRRIKEKADTLAKSNQLGIGLITVEQLLNIKQKITNEAIWNTDNDTGVRQEVDVIAIKGMQAYFISCKSRVSIENEHLVEIANESKKAGAVGIIATCLPVAQAMKQVQLNRAAEDHIAVLGSEELTDEKQFQAFLNRVII